MRAIILLALMLTACQSSESLLGVTVVTVRQSPGAITVADEAALHGDCTLVKPLLKTCVTTTIPPPSVKPGG